MSYNRKQRRASKKNIKSNPRREKDQVQQQVIQQALAQVASHLEACVLRDLEEHYPKGGGISLPAKDYIEDLMGVFEVEKDGTLFAKSSDRDAISPLILPYLNAKFQRFDDVFLSWGE